MTSKKEPKSGIAKHVELFPKSALEKMTVEQLKAKSVYMRTLVETIQKKWDDEINNATKDALDIQSAVDIVNDMLSSELTESEISSYMRQKTDLQQKIVGSEYKMNAIAYKNGNKIEYLESQIKSIDAMIAIKADGDIKDAEKKIKNKGKSE